jgi:glycosyltransferase involved in cell wall biosynthesis
MSKAVEIIIVDDHSKDSTLQIVDPFLRLDHVRLERNFQNLGLTGNWQRALSLGSGEIVTLLHMDDWYSPECLQVIADAFAADPALAMLSTGQTFHYDDGRTGLFTAHHIATFTGAEYVDFQLQLCECPAPSTVFFRRSLLEKVSPYYREDYLWFPELDLYIRLALANPSAKFRHCREILVHRGSDASQFSARFPGLIAIDACTALLNFGDMGSSYYVSLASRRAGRLTVANGIAAALLKRDVPQIRHILSHSSFRRWVLHDPLGVAYILARISTRGARRIITKILV